MEEKKKIEIEIEMLANIHNALVRLHPTGEDIISVASIIMDLRRTLESEVQDADTRIG